MCVHNSTSLLLSFCFLCNLMFLKVQELLLACGGQKSKVFLLSWWFVCTIGAAGDGFGALFLHVAEEGWIFSYCFHAWRIEGEDMWVKFFPIFCWFEHQFYLISPIIQVNLSITLDTTFMAIFNFQCKNHKNVLLQLPAILQFTPTKEIITKIYLNSMSGWHA
jgi:hypothetical protein